MTQTVLLTRGLSAVVQALGGVRQDMVAGEFRLLASYPPRRTALGTVADHVAVEPEGADDAAYLDWLMALVAEQGVDIVWPQSRLRALLRARDSLDASGVTWILPTPDLATYDRLDDKAAFLEFLAEVEPDVPLADYRVVRTADELLEGADALRTARPGLQLCIKPVKGIYGSGFRLVDDRGSPYRRWLDNDVYRIGWMELMGLMRTNEDERAFLIMEYLPGAERSLDCLSDHGTLRVCVTRRKGVGRVQFIDPDPGSQELAVRLCRAFGLHGVVNIQTRERVMPDGQAVPCVLEINTRMSGGTDMCRAGGVNLPLLALRQAAGRLDTVPQPAWGAEVTMVEQGVRLAAP